MGLEATTLISGLNASWPLGASDLKSQGDDHIRVIKAALLGTFPAITGPVTVSHTVLNAVQDASSLNAGVLANARVQQSNVTQHEAALGSSAATPSVIARRDGSADIVARTIRTSLAVDDASVVAELGYRVEAGADNYTRFCTIARLMRQLILSGAVTIAADPGTTPSGTPGSVFLYY